MISFYDVFIKLGLGILCLTFQINLMGKGNSAPTSAMDQVQNYVVELLEGLYTIVPLLLWNFFWFL